MPIYRMTDAETKAFQRIYRKSEIQVFSNGGPSYVYALADTDDPDEVRYIGVSHNPIARFFAHGKGGAGSLAKITWAREVFSRKALIMYILWLYPTREEALVAEQKAIEDIASPKLLNVAHNAQTTVWEERRAWRARIAARVDAKFTSVGDRP